MNSYEKYILISDLDGTLINSKQEVSRENREAVKYFIDNGGVFSIATGRNTQNIRPYIKGLEINGPCILYNGSAVYDFGREKFFNTEYLENKLVIDYIEYCMDRFNGMVVEIFTPDKMYIVTPEENVDPFVLRENQEFELADIKEVFKKNWIKVMLSDSHQNLLEAEKTLKAYGLEEQVGSVFSHEYYFEILKKDISKGAALKYIRQMEEYKDRSIVAVGDFDNDIEMIKGADVGIAVDNARENLKLAADKITVSNDHNAIHNIIYNIIPAL